jgi:hypothetical protein
MAASTSKNLNWLCGPLSVEVSDGSLLFIVQTDRRFFVLRETGGHDSATEQSR